jgi:hypothetical protein
VSDVFMHVSPSKHCSLSSPIPPQLSNQNTLSPTHWNAASALQQPEVSSAQIGLHAIAPAAKPRLSHVAPPRSNPSHDSSGSITPLPHGAPGIRHAAVVGDVSTHTVPAPHASTSPWSTPHSSNAWTFSSWHCWNGTPSQHASATQPPVAGGSPVDTSAAPPVGCSESPLAASLAGGASPVDPAGSTGSGNGHAHTNAATNNGTATSLPAIHTTPRFRIFTKHLPFGHLPDARRPADVTR